MSNNREIGIRLVLDDDGTPKLVRFSRETRQAMQEAAQGAKKLDEALKDVDRTSGSVSNRTSEVKRFGRETRQSMQDAAKGARNFDNAMHEMDIQSGSLTRKLFSMQGAIAGLGLGYAATKLTSLWGGFEKGETVLAGVYKSATLARGELEALLSRDYTRVFGMDGIQNVKVKLDTVREVIGDTDLAMRALTESVAAFGGGTDELKRATVAVWQMAGKGVISLEELRQQLGEAVPDAARLMAKGLGMEMGEMLKVIERGQLDAGQALTAMFEQMELEHAGSVGRLAEIYEGQMGQIGHIIKMFFKDVGDAGAFDALKAELSDVIQSFRDMADDGTLKAWAQSLGGTLADVVKLLGWARENSDLLTVALGGGTSAWAVWRAESFLAAGGVQKLGTRVKALWALINAHPMALAVAGITALVAALASMETEMEAAERGWREGLKRVKEAGRAYNDTKNELDLLADAMPALEKAVEDSNADRSKEADLLKSLVERYPVLKTHYKGQGQSIQEILPTLREYIGLKKLEAEQERQTKLGEARKQVQAVSAVLSELRKGLDEALKISDEAGGKLVGGAKVKAWEAFSAANDLVKKYIELGKLKADITLPELKPEIEAAQLEIVNYLQVLLGNVNLFKDDAILALADLPAKALEAIQKAAAAVVAATTGQGDAQAQAAQAAADRAKAAWKKAQDDIAASELTTTQKALAKIDAVYAKHYAALERYAEKDANFKETGYAKELAALKKHHLDARQKILDAAAAKDKTRRGKTQQEKDRELQAEEQAWADHWAKYVEIGEKAAKEWDRKRDALGKEYLAKVEKLSGDEYSVKLKHLEAWWDEYYRYHEKTLETERVRLSEVKAIENERLEASKGILEKTLDQWTDTSAAVEETWKNALQGIQDAAGKVADAFLDDFRLTFDEIGDIGKAVFKNLLSSLITTGVTSMVGSLGKALNSALSQAFSNAGQGSSSSSGDYEFDDDISMGGGGSWSFGKDWAGAGGGPFADAGGWAYGLGGGAGTIGGSYLGESVFGQSKYGGTLATLGGSLGAAAGSYFGPLGSLAGGLIGSFQGQMWGSLFGGGDDEKEAIEAYERFQKNLGTAQESGIQSWSDYASLVSDYHKSDNRASQLISSEDLAALAQNAGLWYAPDAYEVSGAGNRTDQGYWMATALGGDLAAQVAELEPATEQLESFAAALDGIGDTLGPWADGLNDVLKGLDLTGMSSGDLASTISERLMPSTQIQAQYTRDLADGLSKLEASQNAANSAATALVFSTNMQADEEERLMALLRSSTGSVEELTAKENELNKIMETLTSTAHELSDQEFADLIARGRELSKELGYQQVDFAEVQSTIADELVPAIKEMVEALKEIPGSIDTEVHTHYYDHHHGNEDSGDSGAGSTGHLGRRVMHSGDLVGWALQAGLITRHGGGSIYDNRATPWRRLVADEVPIIAQTGEFIIRRSSVTPENLPFLREFNQTGQIPAVPVPVAAQGRASGGGETNFIFNAPIFNIDNARINPEDMDELTELFLAKVEEKKSATFGSGARS